MGRGAHDTEHHRPTFTRIPTESEEIEYGLCKENLQINSL